MLFAISEHRCALYDLSVNRLYYDVHVCSLAHLYGWNNWRMSNRQSTFTFYALTAINRNYKYSFLMEQPRSFDLDESEKLARSLASDPVGKGASQDRTGVVYRNNIFIAAFEIEWISCPQHNRANVFLKNNTSENTFYSSQNLTYRNISSFHIFEKKTN